MARMSELPAYGEVVPFGHTALRMPWTYLPPGVRSEVARRTGSKVVDAESRDAGFTPGVASVLTCEDGSRIFLKAASARAQRAFAASYREEARKLRSIPAGVPAPRLLWALDDEWVVLGIEHDPGALPHRPWQPAELDACLDALETVADLLTPPPPGPPLPAFLDELTDMLTAWDRLLTDDPDLPHGAEAAALVTRLPDVVAGDTVVHTDVRADNVLVSEGAARICDWNWLVRGAPWLDTVFLLAEVHGDGLDAGALLAERRLTRDVPADDVDCLLAAQVGYFRLAASAPVPPSSPHVRDHQQWMADVTWDWLCRRRGWVPEVEQGP
jgi:hypothetical protein